MRRYIHEYVTCKTCKSPDTLLAKENRVWFIACESCGSKRSVSAIKTGFQAQTTVFLYWKRQLRLRNERFYEIKSEIRLSCLYIAGESISISKDTFQHNHIEKCFTR